MPTRWSDEEDEEEERFPALHPETRRNHLRRMARHMTPDTSRMARLVGAQYLFLAILVSVMLIFGPLLHLRFPRQMWWLILLYALGGLTLIWNNRRRHR